MVACYTKIQFESESQPGASPTENNISAVLGKDQEKEVSEVDDEVPFQFGDALNEGESSLPLEGAKRLTEKVLSDKVKFERLTPNAEQVRVRAGKIAIESTIIANEATKNLQDGRRKDLYQQVSRGELPKSESLPGRDGQESSDNGGGLRATGSPRQAESGGGLPSGPEIQKAQELALEKYAKTQGLWFDRPDRPVRGDLLKDSNGKPKGVYFKSGMEAEVFKDEGETFVFKTINPYQFSLDPLEFLDRIAISNTLFDREQITVEGYGRNSDGDFFAVIKQPYIRIDRGLNEEEATAFMQRLGFKDLGKTFVNEDFVLDDLHSGNIVLDEKGIVRVIDAAAWLNTKEEGYAGKRVLGTLPRVEDDVEMQSLAKSSRFKEIDRPLFDRLVQGLKSAIPTKVSTDFAKARKVLKELNYNVDALFGNETMAFTPATKKLFEKAKGMDRVGKSLQEIREETGWFIGLDGNWKYAIDDSYARLLVKEDQINRFVKEGTELPLKRVLIHEKLDQHYPELAKKIKVTFY